MSHLNRPTYHGEPITHALLQRRRMEVDSRRTQAVERVDRLLSTQRTLGRELTQGLTALGDHGEELRRMERAEADSSLLASLVRPFTARRSALARRSIAEGLLRQYEAVSQRLREATAFTDELRLTALELQQEVDRIHQELALARKNEERAKGYIADAEAALEGLSSLDLSPEARARRRDQFEFGLRAERVALSLYQTAAEQCASHLDPARALRNTVLQLHEEMAKYVLTATHTVNAAGRRIQGLGMLADAPLVIADLQESLDDLASAMEATQRFVEQGQQLIGKVLPGMAERLGEQHRAESTDLAARLERIDADAARRDAEESLRREAADEVKRFLEER